jgi:GAF domain-containing protein
LTPTAIAPFTNLIDLAAAIIEKIQFQQFTERRLADLQTLWNINQAISVTAVAEIDLAPLYQVIHDQVVKVMGDFSTFMIILYDNIANMIRVVYAVEENKMLSLPPIPLGEGLSSIVIRTGRPLLLTDNTPEAIQALGVVAVTFGAAAKSWLGVPMLYGGETFGLIVVQDIEQAHRFGEEDERLLSTIAGQVAVVLRNAKLLETSRKQAEQERLVNEIVGKIRRSVDMETILKTTAEELSTALGAYRAHIQIAPRMEVYQPSEVSSDGSAADAATSTLAEVN